MSAAAPETSILPLLNACLNGTAAVLLVAGLTAIRRRRVRVHVACMAAAALTSALFLVSYLTYHFQVGSVKYTGTGALRVVYFTILITHTVLAVVNVPLIVVTLVRALRRDFQRHRKIARVTLPVWLYVSLSGIAVYWMLYRL